MSIGNKIREMRILRSMTQEELSDLLGVSFQSVSKWECGTTCPDLTLIVPIARLFGITTDELLCADEDTARRKIFDQAYHQYWEKNDSDMYEMAKKACAEFPGDMKYLSWLADEEYYMAFNGGGNTEQFRAMLEESVKHCKIVIEHTTDTVIKNRAIHCMALDLKYLERPEEASEYAEKLPDVPSFTKDEILSYILTGDKLKSVQQRTIYRSFENLLYKLDKYCLDIPITDESIRFILQAEEALIHAVIPDENYLEFHFFLHHIYLKKAMCAMSDNEYDLAADYLNTAKFHASMTDKLHKGDALKYTCPLFAGYEYRWKSVSEAETASIDYWRSQAHLPLFEPIKKKIDFS